MTKRKASVALDTGNDSDQSNNSQDNTSNSNSTTNLIGPNDDNQKAQNRSSTGNSESRHHQIGGQNNQSKSKKERADNWSNAEIQVLHRGIESRRDIFYGPPSQASKKNREIAWSEITKEVNSVSTTPRSLGQVMKKFKNEKCRAKRKFTEADKDVHGSVNIVKNYNGSMLGNSTNNNGNTDLSAQNHSANGNQMQPQQQPHHMTASESMSSQPSSINVVKLAPQNMAKTMIDLPSHVQQIQMPNDDMVLIVPSEMDGLLSGMNLVSDGGGHHHFQKCSSTNNLNGQSHSHHGSHTIQAINTGPGLVNGTMSNGMTMARTIPAASMCSLVYSAGGEICSTDQHLTNNLGPNALTANHLGVNAHGLLHHRTPVEQTQGQQQQQQQQQPQPQHQQQQQPPQQPHQQHHHQLHQHQQQPQQQRQQSSAHQAPQPQQLPRPNQHHQHHLQQSHLASTTSAATGNTNPGSGSNTPGGAAIESQLKNLLFNLLLKDGQHAAPVTISNQDHAKQRNDVLTMIANSLSKIEGHLSKISKVASLIASQNNAPANEISAITANNSLGGASSSLDLADGGGQIKTINNVGGGNSGGNNNDNN